MARVKLVMLFHVMACVNLTDMFKDEQTPKPFEIGANFGLLQLPRA
jgi:hypothetical protein